MQKRIAALFNIQPGEGRMVALVLAYAIFLYFSNMMARTASTGLFFGEYDAATLPYTSIVLMVVGPLVSMVYLQLNNRYSLSKVLLGVHGFLLLSLILLPLLLSLVSSPALVFILPIYFGVNNSLTISSFWNLLGRIYNLRQGKRLFGLLSSGEHMATIVAGFMAPSIIARIGTANLYWIGALFMVLTIGMLIVISRANAQKMDTVLSSGGKGRRQSGTGLGELLKEPYVRLIFALFGLFIVGIFMVSNINYSQAEIRFPSADAMASYVAVFMGIFGVLSLIIQWFIAGRVMERFGVRSMILATPGGLLVLMSLFALVGTFTEWTNALFWLAASAAMYQAILDAVDSASVNLLYQPLPAQLRTQAQTTVMGVIYPLAIGVAGIVLAVLINGLGFDPVQLSYATLVVIGIWLYVGILLGRAYPKRLREALNQRSLGGMALPRPDRDSIGIFEEALQSPHPAAVLYALDILANLAPETMPQRLPALLDYPDDDVRLAALERIAALSWPETPAGVLALLEGDASGEVRAAALRTWAAIDPQSATESLARFSEDGDPAVQAAALAMMRLHDRPDVRQQGIERLEALATSSDPAQRRLLAEVIGETAVPTQTQQLLDLLQDEDPAVRQAALEAAAHARFPDAWSMIVPALAESSVRAQALAALVAGGETAVPAMAAACGPESDPRILGGIAEVCGRIGGERAAALLLEQLQHAEPVVRHQALLALSQIGYQAEGTERETIEALLQREAAAAAAVTAAQVDVGLDQYVQLTTDALEKKRLLLADNLLLLLSFLVDPQTVLSARDALLPAWGGVDEERSSYALEALDLLVSREQKELLFPVVQEMDAAQRLLAVNRRYPQELLGRDQRLLQIAGDGAAGGDQWTRLCAIYALGQIGDPAAAEVIAAAAGRDPGSVLLAETAVRSLEQLGIPPAEAAKRYPSLAGAAQTYETRDPAQMSVMQKAELLHQVSIFSNIPNEALAPAASLMAEVRAAPGDAIMRKGDPGDYLYVVVDGHVRAHDGQHTLSTMGSGGVIGEVALLDEEPRSASVTAVSETHLLRLDQDSFYSLLAAEPALARDLMALLSRRLRTQTQALSEAAGEQPAVPLLPATGQQPVLTGVGAQRELQDLEKVVILKGVDLFGTSDERLLGQLARLFEEVDLAGGETLFEAGDPGESLYVVVVGQLSVLVDERVITGLGEGEVLGEMALLERQPRSATVKAVVPSQLLRLDQDAFFELLEAQPELARGIIAILSRRIRRRWDDLA